jgi:polyisoprenyl-phosphate glycosyltransferase
MSRGQLNLKDQIASLRGPVIILGASGFIGANLFNLISSVRSDVFAVVQREKSWRLADVDDDRVIAVDLNDISAVKNLIATVKPQTVMDCAAYGAYSFEGDADKI